MESIISKLVTNEISNSYLESVAEEVAFAMTRSEMIKTVFLAASDFFYMHILHLLLIIFVQGCKVFVSASPRTLWYCRLFMKNSVLES